MTAILAAGLALRLGIAPSLGYLGVDGDLLEHKQAVHRALTRGLHTVYASNPAADPALTGRPWNGDYFFNNLPVVLYVRCAAGVAYRWVDPRGFDLWSSDLNYFALERRDLAVRLASTRGLTVLLKLPGILADGLIICAVFACGRTCRSERSGLLAAAAYAFNPGVVLNTAFWGQHDPLWIALVLWSLRSLGRGRAEWAWGAYALAALTKPQAWAFAPLMIAGTFAWFSWRRALLATAVALATVVAVLSPFLLHGTSRAALSSVVQSTLGGEPFLSCNALNFWWLASGGRGYGIPDSLLLLGPLTARTIGIAVVLALNAVALWRLRGGPPPSMAALACVAAFVYLAFFVFATELHENHLVAAIPLLLAGAGGRRSAWVAVGLLSLVLVVAIVVFDPALACGFDPYSGAGRALTVGTSLLSVAALCASYSCLRSDRTGELRT